MVVLAYLKRDLANELDKNNDGKIDSSEAAGQGQGYLDMLGSQFAARGAVPPGAAPAATGRAVDGPAVHAVHRAVMSVRSVCVVVLVSVKPSKTACESGAARRLPRARVVSDPHDNGIQKHGKVDHAPLSHAPRSSEARALPLPARTKTSRMSIVARWRHPFRQASFIVAVATLAAVSPTSPPSLSGPFMMQAQPTPLAPMPTCPACSPVRRCLCCRPAELCSAGPPRRLRCRCIAVGSSFLSTVIGGCHRCSLSFSLPGQLQPAVSGRRPPLPTLR